LKTEAIRELVDLTYCFTFLDQPREGSLNKEKIDQFFRTYQIFLEDAQLNNLFLELL